MNLDSIPFIPAHNGPSGGVTTNTPAAIIVMHSMQCPPDDNHVTNWTNSLSSPSGGQYYAHYYIGPTTLYRVAPLGRTLWHCGNGNSVSGLWTLGIEQAGYAAQDSATWQSSGVLDHAKDLVSSLVAAGHGANRWLEVGDLQQPGIRGVTSHNNMGKAFGGSDHTDPGNNYPHDILLSGGQVAPVIPPYMTPNGESVMTGTVVKTSQGGYKEYLIYPSGIAIYLRTADDTNLAIFCGAKDARNVDGTPFLRISASSSPAI